MPTLGECPEVVAVELGGPRCRSDPIRDGVAGFAARTSQAVRNSFCDVNRPRAVQRVLVQDQDRPGQIASSRDPFTAVRQARREA